MSRWRRPSHRDLQTVLAVLGVATAMALPVTLLSVGGGVAAHEIAQLEQSGYQIAVSGGGVHGLAGVHALADQIENVSDVAWASPILSTSLDAFVPGQGPSPVLAEGVIPAAFSATQTPPERALFPTPLPLGDPSDQLHFAGGTYGGPAVRDVLVSTPFAASAGIAIGASIVLAPDANASRGESFTVTGTFGLPPAILGPTAADAIVLPLSDLQVLAGVATAPDGALLDEADTIQVALVGPATTSPRAVDRAAAGIEALAPYYGVTSLTDQAQELEGSQAILNGFYLGLSSVSLAVGFLFLGLVLVRRVERERAEIAIRRAIGVPARGIAGEMLARGAGLAAAGAIGGITAGWGVVQALTAWGAPNVAAITRLAVFTPETMVLLAVGALLLSVPASVAATRAALRLSVPEALR